MDSKQDGKLPHGMDERRAAVRHDSKELGRVVARILGECDARLLDVSRRGVLFESVARLIIGSKTSFRITTTDTSVAVTGTVVRSRVAMLGKSVVYQTALELDEDLMLVETLPAPAPPSTPSTGAIQKAASTSPPVARVRVDGLGIVHAPSGDVLSGEEVEFVAIVPHDYGELRRRAIAHDTDVVW